MNWKIRFKIGTYSPGIMFQMFIPAVSHKGCWEFDYSTIFWGHVMPVGPAVAVCAESQLTQPLHLLFSFWEDERSSLWKMVSQITFQRLSGSKVPPTKCQRQITFSVGKTVRVTKFVRGKETVETLC